MAGIFHTVHLCVALVVGAGGLLLQAPDVRAEVFEWDLEQPQIRVDIENWPLPQLMREISNATRWDVGYEPGAEVTVSAKFRTDSANQALRNLLPNLNFSLTTHRGGSATLLVFRDSVRNATLIIKPDAGEGPDNERGDVIEDELIVVLKPDSQTTIEELARRLGATVIGRIDELNAYRLKFENSEAAEAARGILAKEEEVASTESNHRISAPQLNESLIINSGGGGFHLKPGPVGKEGQVIIGLLDTAVHADHSSAKDFLLTPIHVAGDPQLAGEAPSHGTSMFETMMQAVALTQPAGSLTSDVRVLPVDVYGQSDQTSTFQIAAGIQAAVNADATIINISSGGPGSSEFMNDLIHQASEKGVVFVASAGNTPGTDPNFPAAYPDVTSVTASDRSGDAAHWANQADSVDVMAPGFSVIHYNAQALVVTGTSPAAATVSGMTASLADQHQQSPKEAEVSVRLNLPFEPVPNREN